MSKAKKCKAHKRAMGYFYGWICPACFPHWGKAPVTEFDKAMRAYGKIAALPGVETVTRP